MYVYTYVSSLWAGDDMRWKVGDTRGRALSLRNATEEQLLELHDEDLLDLDEAQRTDSWSLATVLGQDRSDAASPARAAWDPEPVPNVSEDTSGLYPVDRLERGIPELAAPSGAFQSEMAERLPAGMLGRLLADMTVLLRYGHQRQVCQILRETCEAHPGDLGTCQRVAEFQIEHELREPAIDTLLSLAEGFRARGNLAAVRRVLEQLTALDPASGRARRAAELSRAIGRG